LSEDEWMKINDKKLNFDMAKCATVSHLFALVNSRDVLSQSKHRDILSPFERAEYLLLCSG